MNPLADVTATRHPPMPTGPGSDRFVHTSSLGRKTLAYTAITAVAVLMGFALVLVDPLLIAGLILSSLFVLAILRRPYLGLVIYLVVFITRIAELFPALAPLRIERAVGALTLLSLVLGQVLQHRKLVMDRTNQTRAMWFLVLAAALSVPFAYWRVGAITGVVDFAKLLVLYVLIVHLVDTRARLRQFVVLYAGLISYLALSSAFNYVRGQLLVAQGIDRAVGATSAGGGPNEMGATMATTIPFFLLFAQSKVGERYRGLLVAGVLLLLVIMVTTGSRSALVGFMAGMGYLWLGSRRKILYGILGLILMAAGFVMMPEQYQGRYSTITQQDLDGSSKARLDVWFKGLRMIKDRPLTGVGISNFGVANAITYSTPDRRSYLESHSLYIQVPAEIGLIGTGAFLWFALAFVRSNRRLRQAMSEDEDDWEFESTLLQAFFCGFLVLLFTGIFGHSLMRYTWYLYAAVGVATLRVYLTSGRPSRPAVARLTG